MNKKLIKEAIGVRPDIVSIAKDVYTNLFPFLQTIKNMPIKTIHKRVIPVSFDGKIFDEKNVYITFNIKYKDSGHIETGDLHLNLKSKRVDDRLTFSNIKFILINMDIICVNDSTVQDLIRLLKSNSAKTISSLAHELKHFFDFYSRKNMSLISSTKYSVAMGLIHQTKSQILEPLVLGWYMTSPTELLVAPTETYAKLTHDLVTKKDFLYEIQKSRLVYAYKQVILMCDYDAIYDKVFNMTLLLVKSNKNSYKDLVFMLTETDINDIEDDEVAKLLTHLIFYNARKTLYHELHKMLNSYIDKSAGILTRIIRFFTNYKLLGNNESLTAEKLFNKISKHGYYSEPDFSIKESPKKNEIFFKREFKKIRDRSNYILRKIYKIYALLPD